MKNETTNNQSEICPLCQKRPIRHGWHYCTECADALLYDALSNWAQRAVRTIFEAMLAPTDNQN